jgi:RNA polymerase sigma-B factor
MAATRLAHQDSFDELTTRVAELLYATAMSCERMLMLREEAAAICRASELRRRRRARRTDRMVTGVPDQALSVDELHFRYAETRDPVLRDRLVDLHAPLAYGLVSRFLHRGEGTEDLQQVALLALVKAVERFDPRRGLQFSTFATPTVLGELKRHFRDKAWVIRLPRRLHDRYLSVQRARDDLAQELGRSPTIPELAERVGSSAEEILQTLEAGDVRGMRSLDTPLPGSDERDLSEVLGGSDEGLAAVERKAALAQLLARLGTRERDVVQLRFYDGLTQMQIAERLGTNQMHVSRLLARSLQRLRALAGDS